MRFAGIAVTVVVLGWALGMGCAGSSGDAVADPEDVGTEVPVEVVHEVVLRVDGGGGGEPEVVEPELFEEDVQGGDCPPGEGCFKDKCGENQDCNSGWCVEHMGEKVCSKICQEECPDGWSCSQVAGTRPDVVFICVSGFPNLCRPCVGAGDCSGVTGTSDACVQYGEGASFCGGACDSSPEGGEECPWGFSCVEVETVDGVTLQQCVADAGECPCTDASIEQGLWTPCQSDNEWGVCTGMRLCTAEGLAACDAAVPAAEECNGVDDNCDGDVDEPTLWEGTLTELCDDENECTDDSCKGELGCVNEALDIGECSDGNPCTVADHCDGGVCVGSMVDCDDGNVCTDDHCTETGGCVFEANGDLCDDGDACTLADQCVAEQCKGVPVDCDCQTDDDCVGLDDGDLCNGTLKCDTEEFPYQCVVDEATIITCPEPEGAHAFCLQPSCDPDTGVCGVLPHHEGMLCDNGDLCTIYDSCVEGECVAGGAINCNDGNLCTDDSCDPSQGCVYVDNELACDDGNVCTVADQCESGVCIGAGELACDDDNVCTEDQCAPGIGCTHVANNVLCDDGNQCTGVDQCEGGSCLPGELTDCDDGDPCTKDYCLAASGCGHDPVSGPCTDGDPCTLNDQCEDGVCAPGPAQVCDDGNVCTDDSCGPDGLCVFSANTLPCDDGNACTDGDNCAEGECVSGSAQPCGDDNPCTDSQCDPVLGCITTLNSAPCDDGDLCTTGDKCLQGECVAEGEFSCDDGNPCTADECSGDAGGCVSVPVEGNCDDGNECTEGDLCLAGVCAGPEQVDCDDGNECTLDSCNPVDGCGYELLDGTACDDGDACTPGDQCLLGDCVPGLALDCDDENSCTDDFCIPLAGCIHSNNSAACDDENLCTVGDECAGGLCQPGTDVYDCEDGDSCTDNWCDLQLGECQQQGLANATPCGEGKWCWNGDCVVKQGGTFCFTGPEKAYMSGEQICNDIFGLPCGPAATKTFVGPDCQGQTIDSGRGCHEMPLDPYNAGSALLVCNG